MSSSHGESPFKPGYGVGPGGGPPPGAFIASPSAWQPALPQPPRPPSTGTVLALVALAALGSVFLFCCGVPLALLKRPGRFQRFQETSAPRRPGLLDEQDDPFKYLDDFNRQNEEELNDFRRRNNEWLRQVERDRERRLRELHRQLDEL